MLEGSLIRKVQPVYPPLAKTARIQGPVVLFAVISRAGTIDNLRVLSGHPMLVPAALDAVKQWQYRPYILNHEPIEVETQITVNFVLGN
jgi:protein TonB